MADDFAKDVQARWKLAEEADHDNREQALEDLAFAAGEQWDERVKNYREGNGPFPLPCLTINTLPQFIGQVVGDRRANPTSIKVLPREGGDKDIAEVRSELIRSIELQSKAERPYLMAFEQAVTCGIGNFRVDLDYAYDDAFERDIFIRSIANPLAVLWDPYSTDPTGRDADYCFVSDMMPRDVFAKRFPKASLTQLDARGIKDAGWASDKTVRVAEMFEMFDKPRTIALMADGSVEDVTDLKDSDYKGRLFTDTDGKPRIRETKCKYAKRILTNGIEQLEDAVELKIPRLPIIRVMGREVWVGDRRERFGLVRFARDPQRLKNFWRSVVAEMLLKAPRANYIARADAIEGREGDWSDALTYNEGAAVPPVPITSNNLAAFINEAQMCGQDMKETTGIHEAELGMRSNETSGVAIQSRKAQGDIATIGYHDSMNWSMQEAGEVINALIPVAYDTARTVRVIGPDESVKLVRINDPAAEKHVDIGKGKYDVTITTGPAYATRIQEASAQLVELASRSPQILEAAPDLIVKTLDIPVVGDQIVERLKRMVPPQVLGDDANDNKDPQEIAAQQQQAEAAAQKQQIAEQMQLASAQADLRLKNAQADKAEAETERAKAEAEKARAEVLEFQAGQALKGAAMSSMAANIDDESGEIAA